MTQTTQTLNGRILPPAAGDLPDGRGRSPYPLGMFREARGVTAHRVGQALMPESPPNYQKQIAWKYESGTRKLPPALACTYAAVMGEAPERIINLANQAWCARWGLSYIPIPEPGDTPAPTDIPASTDVTAATDIPAPTGLEGQSYEGQSYEGQFCEAGAAPTGSEQDTDMTMNSLSSPSASVGTLPAGLPPTRLKPVTGRDLERVIARYVWTLGGGRPHQVLKLSEEGVRAGLAEGGWSATVPQVRGAIVSMMTNSRLVVVRECSDFGVRVYKTTERLKTFAGDWAEAEAFSDTLEQLPPNPARAGSQADEALSFSAGGQRDGKTVAQKTVAPTAPDAPAPALPASNPPELNPDFGTFQGDRDLAYEDVRTEMFDNQMLDLLVRAGNSRDADRQVSVAQAQRDQALAELEAAGERYQALQADRDNLALKAEALASRTALDGRDRHAMKKAIHILGRLSEQMTNPMVAAFFGSINVKAPDLAEALAAASKLAEGD